MTDLRKAAEMALEACEHLHRTGDTQVFDLCYADKVIPALRQALAQPKREWEELDVNEVREIIYEHVPDPSPELLDKLYGLIAEADRLLQEKNT